MIKNTELNGTWMQRNQKNLELLINAYLYYELFEDKIVSYVDELKREYFYHQITKMKYLFQF